MDLADSVYVLEAGHVEMAGSPSELSEEMLMTTALGS
jgi:ABC-type branched-subunit amino acid transport system ATPase component